MSTMTSVEHRPRQHRAATRVGTSWAVQYRYPGVKAGLSWVRDETVARHWARVFRRYGATVKLLRNERDTDTWYRLHENGTDLIPAPELCPPGSATDSSSR
jgi:hypothetical protein